MDHGCFVGIEKRKHEAAAVVGGVGMGGTGEGVKGEVDNCDERAEIMET